MGFIYFLGRFHVVVLHIPLGVIVAIVLLEWLARKPKYRYLEAASPLLWGIASVSALVTVMLGYMHFAEGGFAGSTVYQHRTFGTALAVLITAVAILRTSKFAPNYTPVYFPAAVLMLLLATITGHYGGNLTHGSDYLIEYAPQPIRSMAGLAPRRPPVTDLAMADPYLDIVGPILNRRCSECHSGDHRENELDLSTYESIMRGSENGSVVVPGRPAVSELLKRVSLPKSDDDFMPADGKTPLTDRQVDIVKWWITIGAPTGTLLGQLGDDLDSEIRDMLESELGL